MLCTTLNEKGESIGWKECSLKISNGLREPLNGFNGF